MSDPKQDILDKMEKKPIDSKKMLSGMFGVGAVLIVWLGTLICMFIKTDSAAQFVSLATIVVSFVGAVTTALITGQSAMEWKSMSTIAQVDTNDKDENTSNQNVNIKEDKVYSLDHVDPKDLDDLDGLHYGNSDEDYNNEDLEDGHREE